MREIKVSYTILDIIEVPDDATDDEIEELCEQNWYDVAKDYNDLEWGE